MVWLKMPTGNAFPLLDTCGLSFPSFQLVLFLQLIIILHHLAERPLFHHDAHNFVQGISRRHGGVLGVGVVSGLSNVSICHVWKISQKQHVTYRNLDNISPN